MKESEPIPGIPSSLFALRKVASNAESKETPADVIWLWWYRLGLAFGTAAPGRRSPSSANDAWARSLVSRVGMVAARSPQVMNTRELRTSRADLTTSAMGSTRLGRTNLLSWPIRFTPNDRRGRPKSEKPFQGHGRIKNATILPAFAIP